VRPEPRRRRLAVRTFAWPATRADDAAPLASLPALVWVPRISSHGDDITAPAIDHGAAVALATFGSPTPQLRLASENSEPVPRSRQSLPKQRVNHVASWKEPSSEGEEEKSSDAGRATHHLVASFSSPARSGGRPGQVTGKNRWRLPA